MPLYGVMPSAAELAGRIPRVPPMTTALGVIASERDTPDRTPAAMLAWGYAPDGWYAGVCFPFRLTRGTPMSALLTVWIPAVQVRQRAGEHYERVPRIPLTGPPGRWPGLPPAYRQLGQEWLALHIHVPVADPTGEYREIRDEIRQLRRGRASEDFEPA